MGQLVAAINAENPVCHVPETLRQMIQTHEKPIQKLVQLYDLTQRLPNRNTIHGEIAYEKLFPNLPNTTPCKKVKAEDIQETLLLRAKHDLEKLKGEIRKHKLHKDGVQLSEHLKDVIRDILATAHAEDIGARDRILIE